MPANSMLEQMLEKMNPELLLAVGNEIVPFATKAIEWNGRLISSCMTSNTKSRLLAIPVALTLGLLNTVASIAEAIHQLARGIFFLFAALFTANLERLGKAKLAFLAVGACLLSAVTSPIDMMLIAGIMFKGPEKAPFG